MNVKRILVFPCGSEIGLEIYRSLRYSRFIELWGGSSISDHGEFIYQNYIGGIPNVHDHLFFKKIKNLIEEYSIDAIYPTMDEVIVILKEIEPNLPCKIISSSLDTTRICLSKEQTYEKLKDKIQLPKIYETLESVNNYPVFIKPKIGYGSRGARKIESYEEGISHLKMYPDSIILEYLPGNEYTIDCFTDRHGRLLFVGPRIRQRTKMGISVNTSTLDTNKASFYTIADIISNTFNLQGAWFFQVKEDPQNKFVLMEVASRLGGSSAVYRIKGINFALLSVFDAFNHDVEVAENNYNVELDRALDNKYRLSIKFRAAYIDFDDCLVVNNKINTDLIKLIFQFRNQNIKIVLLTKHEGDINNSLAVLSMANIFDEIVHIKKNDKKYLHIDDTESIFIDDSFAERNEVHTKLGIPVFSIDMIEALLC